MRHWRFGASLWLAFVLGASALLPWLCGCSGAERLPMRGIDMPSRQSRAAIRTVHAAPEPLADGSHPGWITPSPTHPRANRCATDPVGDVAGLNTDPDYVLGYRTAQSHPHATWAPTRGGGELAHRQGIQRLFLTGRNYLTVSNSTRRSHAPGFEVVRMASHSTTGEALGSGGTTPRRLPPQGDQVVVYQREPLTNEHAPDGVRWGYDHAGGIQLLGQYLLVPIEHTRDLRPAGFRLADLTDPERPRWGPMKLRERGNWTDAGAAALTRLRNGAYLAMVFGRGSSEVEVFVSTALSVDSSWRSWKSTWHGITPPGFAPYQNLQLITDCAGRLYLLGTHNHTGRRDWADLWQVRLTTDQQFAPSFEKVTQVSPRCRSPRTGHVRFCNFHAGGGAYVSPTGRLFLYGVEPHDRSYPGGATAVRVREFCKR
jgi:hypothetical protein